MFWHDAASVSWMFSLSLSHSNLFQRKGLFSLLTVSTYYCSNYHLYVSIEMTRRMPWSSTLTLPTSLSCGGRKCSKPQRTREKRRGDRRCVCVSMTVYVMFHSIIYSCYILHHVVLKCLGESVSRRIFIIYLNH